MLPNPTSITLQEILNLGNKIRVLFGTYDISAVDFHNFGVQEQLETMLVIANFEDTSGAGNGDSYSVLYGNNWGELFLERVGSTEAFHGAFNGRSRKERSLSVHYHVQRTSLQYEKIVERAKRMVMETLEKG